ncbi:MAG: DUF2220 domain-containing protein [Treponema sp.]|nr:DUF2220 domain-containing protein [Treponema sp.]
MSDWKKKIIDELINHYFDSDGNTQILRLRSSVLFPDYDTAHPNEKDSYIEDALELELKQVVQLRWEKHNKGERLKTISCNNFKALFMEAGKPYPKDETEKIKTMLTAKVNDIKTSGLNIYEHTESIIQFIEYLSQNISIREIGHGINLQIINDFIRFLEFISEQINPEKITIRALSILLYNDSKHLENILSVCSPLILNAQKIISMPAIYFLERAYPEVMVSGKLVFEYISKNTSLINSEGLILSFPLESVKTFSVIRPIAEKQVKKVLTIENKETFYALGSPVLQYFQQDKDLSNNLSQYDCFLYTGGYPNRAVTALIEILAASDFSFYHAGDLDPDGICILQQIHDITQKPVTPTKMDTSTFFQYQKWARPLTKTMLSQMKKINEKTRNITELAGLIECIEKTGLGVEQEIIDYR